MKNLREETFQDRHGDLWRVIGTKGNRWLCFRHDPVFDEQLFSRWELEIMEEVKEEE